VWDEQLQAHHAGDESGERGRGDDPGPVQPAQARRRDRHRRETLDQRRGALVPGFHVGRGGVAASHDLDRHQQAIAAAGQRLHVARRRRLVAQRGADLPNAEVEGLLEVDEGAFRPDLALDLFPRDQLTAAADEHDEDARRLRLEARARARLPQLAASRIQLEDPEAEPAGPLSLHPQQVRLSAHRIPSGFRLAWTS
jgi:hypothetical protein